MEKMTRTPSNPEDDKILKANEWEHSETISYTHKNGPKMQKSWADEIMKQIKSTNNQ